MAYYGVYRGNVIETPHRFNENQKVMIIPVDDKEKQINLEKKQIIDKLFGCVQSNMTLEEIKEERLRKFCEAVD
ncbi:MAG: hypothetical protein II969_16510 [Anaerolineaceae bacterium]|nr:hypothetical protein [Anaerolineaceae bacterium]